MFETDLEKLLNVQEMLTQLQSRMNAIRSRVFDNNNDNNARSSLDAVNNIGNGVNVIIIRRVELEGKRHLDGDERYDGNTNVIVPDEEMRLFRDIKRVDAEMTAANDQFIRAQTYLKHMSVEYSKLKDSVNARFEVILLFRFSKRYFGRNA